ncbi:MAG: hypothetical protein PHQ05_06265 [Sterolibacterium sp.]|nr:hypothetical protein [Sterolibacterium sp.]
MTGGTLQMARAAADGAMLETALQVRLLHAADAGADDLLNADGYITFLRHRKTWRQSAAS